MQTIITIITVLNMYMNCAQDLNGKYFYNADINNGIVETLYVYEKTNNGLTHYLSYNFEYDAEGRLTDKTVNRWDSWTNSYRPTYKLHLNYNVDSYELTRSEWKESSQEWTASVDKTIYHLEQGHLTGVTFLHRANGNQFKTVNHLNVLNPREDMLLAQALR